MRVVQIDAFTERAFGGNPAAVCLVESFPEARAMQILAREMNLSETAFLKRAEDGFELRWFTPSMEVDLCGHATLASAHFLWESGELEREREARFYTRSGLLTAVQRDPWIEMDFPAQPATPAQPVHGLLEAVRAEPVFVGRNDADWLIELESEREVMDLDPDLRRLGEICERGLIATSRSTVDRYDFVSRFFAPAAGVPEDPVTGSAHCSLGPYWGGLLDKDELVGYQASARGGVVRVRLAADRVLLAGQAVTVLDAELTVPWPQID